MSSNTIVPSWTKKIADDYNTHRQDTHTLLQNGGASMKKVNIAGVLCTTPDVDKTTAITKNILCEMEAENVLRQKLQSENLSYEGMLPTSVWINLLSHLKSFFTFKTLNEEGKVKADVYNEYIKDSDEIGNVLMVTSWISYIALIILAAIHVTSWWWLLSLPSVGIIGCLLSDIHDGDTDDLFVISFIAPLAAVYAAFGVTINNAVKWRKNRLWPGNTDTDISGEYIKIELPEADIVTQKRLVQWHNTGKKLYLVVHKNGFKVNVTDAERELYKAKWDPIICYDTIEKGQEITVIVAQYGPEPAEKALMEELVQKHYKHVVTTHIMNNMN